MNNRKFVSLLGRNIIRKFYLNNGKILVAISHDDKRFYATLETKTKVIWAESNTKLGAIRKLNKNVVKV